MRVVDLGLKCSFIRFMLMGMCEFCWVWAESVKPSGYVV
jgi:hypothetical protein